MYTGIMMSYGYDKNNGRPVASPSALSTLNKCVWEYWVKYWENYKHPSTSSSLIVGSMVHTAIEGLLTPLPEKRLGPAATTEAFIQSWRVFVDREDPTLDSLSMVEAYIEDYSNAIAECKQMALEERGKQLRFATRSREWLQCFKHTWDANLSCVRNYQENYPHVDFGDDDLLDMYRRGKRCMDNFRSFANREILGKDCQVELQVGPLELHGELKTGRLDLLVVDDDVLTVWDFKTGRKQWSEEEVYNNPQLLWYLFCMDSSQLAFKEARVGIVDLYNRETIVVPVDVSRLLNFVKRLEGDLTNKKACDIMIEENGTGQLLKERPLPLGRGVLGCPCNLSTLPKDNHYRCPIYEELPNNDE